MCGISGFIASQGNVLPNALIFQMTELIRHRGPDDEGYILLKRDNKIIVAGGQDTPDKTWKRQAKQQPFQSITSCKREYSLLALGHRCMRIKLDSPENHQPMACSNGRYWIVFNGTIYNYQDIRKELEKAPYTFITNTETETILAAYSYWGEKCFERFVGMWSIAIYDNWNKEIILSRDRYGIKPLYYYFSTSGDLYFGSEIKQFTVLSEWKARINQGRVYDQLIYSFADHTDETMFSDVYQIPPGCLFKSDIRAIKKDRNGKLEFQKWYIPAYEPFKGSFNDAVFRFKNLFHRSVNDHYKANVPVGAALSGGLDSSSITCVANQILRSKNSEDVLKTFSVSSSYEKYNEKKWADLVIDHIKSEAYFVQPSLTELLEMTPTILWYQDEPYMSQSASLAYSLYNLVKVNNVQVLLNGQGADEYLGGYGQFTIPRYATMFKNMGFKDIMIDIKAAQKIKCDPYSEIIAGITYHLLPKKIKRFITAFKSSSDHSKNIIDLNILEYKPTHPFDMIPVPYKSVREVSDHLTFYSSLPKYLHWEDRSSSAHSIEARVPFLDHRLVEFNQNLPDNFLEQGGVTKRILRHAMRGLLPEDIRNRKDKMGFTTPKSIG